MSHWTLGSYASTFSDHFLLLIGMRNTTFTNYENPSKPREFFPPQMSLELKQVKHNLFTRGSVYNSFLTAMLRAFFFLFNVICFTDFESSFSSPQTLYTLFKKSLWMNELLNEIHRNTFLNRNKWHQENEKSRLWCIFDLLRQQIKIVRHMNFII